MSSGYTECKKGGVRDAILYYYYSYYQGRQSWDGVINEGISEGMTAGRRCKGKRDGCCK